MKKAVKWILIVIIILAIGGMIVYSKNKPLTTDIIKIEPKVAQMYFIKKGQVISPDNVTVYSEVSGEILELNVEEKAKINEGDVICVIDSTDYEYKIKQMESDIKGYQAKKSDLSTQQKKEKDTLVNRRNELSSQLKTIDEQKKTATLSKEEQLKLQQDIVDQNKTGLDWALENFENTKLLYEQGVLPEANYNSSRQKVDAAKAVLEQSQQQLEVIRNTDSSGSPQYYNAMKETINTQIGDIDKSMSKSYTGSMASYYDSLIAKSYVTIEELKNNISDCTVKAPISGTIKKLNIKDTNIASQTAPIVEIEKEGTDEIEVFVSTNDVDYVIEGMDVGLILKRRDGDKEYVGKVDFIEKEAVETTNALGVMEKSVKVKIKPDNLEPFKTGFDVDVKFVYYEEKDVLTVPKTALFEYEEKDMVWVVRDGVGTTVEVTKGVELQTDTVITNGLNNGDFVVVDVNVDGLKNGVKVTDEE